jgi:hypothetical protein
MKRILVFITILALWAQFPAYSYAFTNSAQLVTASDQKLYNSSVVLPSSSLTMEGYLYFNSIPPGGGYWEPFGTRSTSGHRSFFVEIDPQTGSAISFFLQLYGGTAPNSSSANWTPTLNTWYHWAVTYDGSTGVVKWYIDGSQLSTATIATGGLSALTDVFCIGQATDVSSGTCNPGAGHRFDGNISNFKLWNTARTAGQISTDMCGTLGATTGLVGEWSLDNVLTDNSGNGYTLTNQNTVTFPANVPCGGAASLPQILRAFLSYWI